MNDVLGLFHEVSPYDGFDASAHPDDLQGWGSADPLFKEVIECLKPKVIVEVGSWKGASSIHMAKLIKSASLDTKIICIDTWLGSPEHVLGPHEWRDSLRVKHGYPQLYYTFLANVVRQNVQDVIIPLPATSESGAIILQRKGVRPDMVYVDAAHDYESTLRDLRDYWKILADTGVLLGDDYITWQGVTQAANQFAREMKMPLFGRMGKFVIPKGKTVTVRIALSMSQ